MNQRNWFQISNTLIEAYKISDISMKLKKLPLQYFYMAAGSYSGPIAILYNKFLDEQYKFGQGYDKSVLIFNCKGQLTKSIPYELKDRVILFQFTQLQQLLIVYANGSYSLIDIYSSSIFESTYFSSNTLNQQKQRCVGADMVKDTIFIIKERQLGCIKSIKSQWECLPFIKIGFQNPVFCLESDQFKNISVHYLSKEGNIDQFSLLTNSKKVIFSHQYLATNWKKLTDISKSKQYMCLIFKQPFKLFYIDLSSNPMPNEKKIKIHQPLLELKPEAQINKKKAMHCYKNMNSQICWLDKFVFYSNKKITLIFDDQSQKAIFKTTKIVSQVDGVRIIGDQAIIYRIMNHIYQELVSYQSFQEYQRNIVTGINNQKPFNFDLQSIGIDNLTTEIKLSIIHQLHKIYQRFINQEIIQLQQMSKFKPVVGQIFKQIVQNAVKCLDKLQLIKILKFATFLQNYFIPQKYPSSQVKPQSLTKINVQNQQSKQNQKGEDFQGISAYLSTPINQLCSQLRIINQLKYSSYMQRFLTIQQFHYLKQYNKDIFVKIFLKYNMHYELDLIFGDTQTKQKIFYHWMKCKIQKWEKQNSTKSAKNGQNPTSSQLSVNNSENQLVQQILDRYSQLKKNLTSTIIFSQISKYCVDRDKLSLALKLIQYEQHTQRRIIVGLLILVAKKDKNMIPKIIQFTQLSKQSSIIYRVIKQLMGFKWIEKHLWVNILHNKPNFKQHYLNYLSYQEDQESIKSFYLQNKLFFQLGFHNVKSQLRDAYIKRKNELNKQQYQKNDIYKLNNQQTELLKLSIIDSSKQFIPSLATNIKKFKKRTSIQALKQIKNKRQAINQKDVEQFKSDFDYQYLGQIILTKDKDQLLAVKVFSKIKSDKCYTILMKIGRFKEAIDLAFIRRNREKLAEIIQLSQETSDYCKVKLAELDRKR